MPTCPDTKPPWHIEDKQERQKWSNSRAHAIKHYKLVAGGGQIGPIRSGKILLLFLQVGYWN